MVNLGAGVVMLWGFVALVQIGKLVRVNWHLAGAKCKIFLEENLLKSTKVFYLLAG